jgi:hypothetical protein
MAGAYSIEEIGRFIQRYNTFAQGASDLRLHQFTQRFGHVRTALEALADLDGHSQRLLASRFHLFTQRFGHVRTALEALADLDRHSQRRLASRFNLFKALGVERREVRTHSAFLAELFRPSGTHAQGTLFLEAFLQHCLRKGGEFNHFPRIEFPTGAAFWEVDCEKSVPDGQLDIVVWSLQSGFLMVIENKIDAAEQKDQIGRYQDWLSRRTEYPEERRALIYLTPDGRRAGTASNEGYFRLSYAKDVVAWLRSALPNVEAPRVRDAVIQYLDLIESLFHFAGEVER